jgi:WD repeat-containing protein 23
MATPSRLRGRRRVPKEVERELEPFTIEEEVSHLTRIASEPCARARSGARRKRGISAFEMLSSRESGRSGSGASGGGFCSADRAYAAGKHLPAEGPWCVEDMDSEAYVSQFSSDGSLLVAGFRVGDLASSLVCNL